MICMRLDKYLAHAGVGTRKEVKQLIRKKHVRVNGELVTKDDIHVDEDAEIYVDDECIYYEKFVYLMLNKPQGVISATDDEQYQTVLDCFDVTLPKGCFPVGRLDIDTEGLLLITNDGKLAHRLLSPKHHVKKTYFVEFESELSLQAQEILCNGSIVLDDKKVLEAQLDIVDERHCYLTIEEGRFHQVKRMFHAVHNEVLFLQRVSMGPLTLDENLDVGEFRPLTLEEIDALKEV